MIKRLSCCFIVMDVKVCRRSPLQILFYYCACACFLQKRFCVEGRAARRVGKTVKFRSPRPDFSPRVSPKSFPAL